MRASKPDVTVYSSVTEEDGVEAGRGVSIWTGTSAGSSQPDMLLMTGGLVLLMAGGSLLLLQGM